jgi:hypothetical protein
MKNKEIQIADIWNEEKDKSLSAFIQSHSEQQSEERKLRNELLSIQYQNEDYIDTEKISEKKSETHR